MRATKDNSDLDSDIAAAAVSSRSAEIGALGRLFGRPWPAWFRNGVSGAAAVAAVAAKVTAKEERVLDRDPEDFRKWSEVRLRRMALAARE